MNITPSPTHPEQDVIGSAKPLGTHSPVGFQNTYPGNPYWSATVDKQPASPLASHPPSIADVPDSVLSDPHLIGALVDAIHEAGKQQRDELVRHLSDWLPQLPGQLAPTVDTCLEQLLPRVIQVEQPGRILLLLVRYLSVGLVVSGLIMGGLLYSWLQAAKERDALAPAYWQHRYTLAKSTVDASPPLRRLLAEADTLYASPVFMAELNRLESLIEARRQRYFLQRREQELLSPPRQSRHK